MAVKLRLMRMGKKKQPTYRVVAADARSPRDGRFIELIGRYDPHPHPSVVEIDNERAVHWLNVGAQPSAAVKKLLEISGAWGQFRVLRGDTHVIAEPAVPETKQRKSKKVRQREAEAAAAAAEPVEAVAEEAAAEEGASAEEPAAEEVAAEPAAEDVAEEPAGEVVDESVEASDGPVDSGESADSAESG
nr:30S ribosomal protein S16 [Desulfuromonadales bacterium]